MISENKIKTKVPREKEVESVKIFQVSPKSLLKFSSFKVPSYPNSHFLKAQRECINICIFKSHFKRKAEKVRVGESHRQHGVAKQKGSRGPEVPRSRSTPLQFASLPGSQLHRVDIKRDRGEGNLWLHFHFKCADTSALMLASSHLRAGLTKHGAISRNETRRGENTRTPDAHSARIYEGWQRHFRFSLHLETETLVLPKERL